MSELLRVAMNAGQVATACEEWARDRSSLDGAAFTIKAAVSANGTAEVVFTKKRVRQPRTTKGAWKTGDGA